MGRLGNGKPRRVELSVVSSEAESLTDSSFGLYMEGITALTEGERLVHIILAERFLGPVFGLWGVVEHEIVHGFLIDDPNARRETKLYCECGKEFCQDVGKHPRRDGRSIRKRKDKSSEKEIFRLLAKYPYTNFAVATGENTLVIDVDVKPGICDGRRTIREAAECGNLIPDTVTVISGRGTGSHHLYFKIPRGFDLSTDTKFLHGIDMKGLYQYVVSPGSRHEKGGYYHFALGKDPEHQEIADLPDWLYEALTTNRRKRTTKATPSQSTVAVAFSPTNASREEKYYDTLPEPGPLRSDSVVLGALRRKHGKLYDGVRMFPGNKSRDDHELANHMAFFTCHNLQQAIRLFWGSGLGKDSVRQKKWKRIIDKQYDYVEYTLRKAFCWNPHNWIPKQREPRIYESVATGAKKGRPPSATTLAVGEAIKLHPDWTSRQFADSIGITPKRVEQVNARLKLLHNALHTK